MVTVLSLGGSIVAPETPDIELLGRFVRSVQRYLYEDASRKLIVVSGGGAPARTYQNAYRALRRSLSSPACAKPAHEGDNQEDRELYATAEHVELDWIGIMATRLNAQLLKSLFGILCPNPVVYDPTAANVFSGQVLVAAGWKPGFSTDTDAVLLAERYSAKTVINLSDVAHVYTGYPLSDKDAKALTSLSWDDFLLLVDKEWVPGSHVPFDPVASVRAKKSGIQVICATGRDLPNLERILNRQEFVGTTIG